MAETGASGAGNIRNSRKSPADFTGKTKERLQAEHDVEVAEAASQMALATAAKAAEQNKIVDYTGGEVVRLDDEVEKADDIEVNEPEITIRVLADIPQMTYGRQIVQPAYKDESGQTHDAVLGALNFYDFEAGVRYKVPRELGLHLIKLEYADRL